MSPETDYNLEFDKTPIKRTLEKHTAEVLATIEKVARAFNPSADASRIQTVISNAIKTSNLSETNQHIEVVSQPKTPEEHKASNEPNMETLKQYLNLGIKLIPVYDDNRFVKDYNNPNSKTKDWGTDDIAEIQSLINGNGYRNGLGKGSKIKLFRFYPSDYGLVVIDIDMHSAEGGKLKGNGLKNWLKIETKLNLPMDCRFESHTCRVSTPSNGFHLYFKFKEKAEFKIKIADAVEIIYTKAVNVAGSVKEGKGYKLIGSLATIPDLPDELKKLMLKPIRIESQPIRRDISSQDPFNSVRGHISKEEIEKYKGYIKEYLIAKGFKIDHSGKTNCPFTKHHKNGDKDPSAQVYPDHLWCHKEHSKYDIYAIASQLLNGGDFRAAFADVKTPSARYNDQARNS